MYLVPHVSPWQQFLGIQKKMLKLEQKNLDAEEDSDARLLTWLEEVDEKYQWKKKKLSAQKYQKQENRRNLK